MKELRKLFDYLETLPQYHDSIAFRELVENAADEIQELDDKEVCVNCAPDCDGCEEKIIKRRFEEAAWKLRKALKIVDEALPMVVQKPTATEVLGALKK